MKSVTGIQHITTILHNFRTVNHLLFRPVQVFRVVTPCSVVVGYQHFRSLHPEDGASMDLWNVGILPQHYTAWQSRRPRLEVSLAWKVQNSHRTFRLSTSVADWM